MIAIDWAGIFLPTVSLVEIAIRGTVVYLLLFLALRFFLKRNAGQLGVADLLVIVLISEASQAAMGGGAVSVVEAALTIAVILFWTFALNWLSFRVPVLRRLTATEPLAVIENGRPNRANMRRELITHEELMSEMRLAGIDDIATVRSAHLEGNGQFSFLRVDGGEVERGQGRTAA